MKQNGCVIFFSFSIIHGWPDSAQNRLYVILEKSLLQKWEICTDSTSSFWNGPWFPLHTARNQSSHADAAFVSFAASDLNHLLETFHLQLTLHSATPDVMPQHLLRWWDLPLWLSFTSWWTAPRLVWCVLSKRTVDRLRNRIQGTQPMEHSILLLTKQHESPDQPCTRRNKSRKLWLGLSKGFSREKTTPQVWPSQSGWQASQGSQLPNSFFLVPPT